MSLLFAIHEREIPGSTTMVDAAASVPVLQLVVLLAVFILVVRLWMSLVYAVETMTVKVGPIEGESVLHSAVVVLLHLTQGTGICFVLDTLPPTENDTMG